MNYRLRTNKLPFCLVVNATAQEPLFVYAQDARKDNTIYMNRYVDVSNGKPLTLKFPQSPDTMFLTIEGTGDYQINSTNVATLPTTPLWKDSDLAEFIPFAQWFCDNAGIFSATVLKNGEYSPSSYRSKNYKFRIDYADQLTDTDPTTGAQYWSNNPAQVGHDSGKITLSAKFFRPASIPVRMAILMHEYCHKFVNPKAGKAIDDEKAADLNAINILLSLGYSEAEIEHAFLNVFQIANNEQNTQRYNLICSFVNDYTSGAIGAH